MHTSVFGFIDRNGQWAEFEESGSYVPEGTPVTVRYDPADPRRSATLMERWAPSTAAETAALVVFGCSTVVLALVVLATLL